MEHVGIRIDELRRQWGLTPIQLWQKSGVPTMRLAAIVEHGSTMTVDEAIGIAAALKSVTARDLLIYQVHEQLNRRQRHEG